MLGCTITSGSAMSTDRQTQPWTRSAWSTTSACSDQASTPGDLIRPLLTSIQSAQLSSDLDTIVAAPDGSCVPAPLSSVCTVASCGRVNTPNRALGRLAGDSWPGCGDVRKPHQVAEDEAELVGAEPLRVIGELVEDGLVQARHRREKLGLGERRRARGSGGLRHAQHRPPASASAASAAARFSAATAAFFLFDWAVTSRSGRCRAGNHCSSSVSSAARKTSFGSAARSATRGSCTTGLKGGVRTVTLTRRLGSNSSAITQPSAKTVPGGCVARSIAAGTWPLSALTDMSTQTSRSRVRPGHPIRTVSGCPHYSLRLTRRNRRRIV